MLHIKFTECQRCAAQSGTPCVACEHNKEVIKQLLCFMKAHTNDIDRKKIQINALSDKIKANEAEIKRQDYMIEKANDQHNLLRDIAELDKDDIEALSGQHCFTDKYADVLLRLRDLEKEKL